MRQSELRKGNWVQTEDGSVLQITGAGIQSEPTGSWPILYGGCIAYYPSFLNPIPITEEWLTRFGFSIKEVWLSKFGANFFREDRKVKVSISNHHGITISLTDKSDSDTYMIDYVHELQNLHKELTGESL